MLKNLLNTLKNQLLNGASNEEWIPIQIDPTAVDQFVEEVTKSDLPVLVDFWAPGCQPCEVLSPIVEKIATQYGNQLKFIKINVEKNFSVPMHYNLDCFPTLLIFRAGKVVEKIVGTVPEDVLTKVVRKHLAT
ncbi:thioredoxin [Gloeocapsopsis dulcis]|uniref:Thioredoxin n=1 Tax=Gloeocapsopsis dulcis AAB1 = 1H9 TaxID=1433147 RepID=A0A6N8FS49_9CHRO|nr:thioredoxin [Gloeocapsopsis dulcis]MUL35948.1 thioredoxin [Gloeocapsopsis dulcis AAB1 = 1H9]WNN88204.1 thioredoxin [Gloeocapsopsis dulcis]